MARRPQQHEGPTEVLPLTVEPRDPTLAGTELDALSTSTHVETDPDGVQVMVMRVRLEPSVDGLLERVERFNREIIGIEPPESPSVLSSQRVAGRREHLLEEIDEFREASNAGNVAEAADALLDLVYVALGAMFEMGVSYGPTFNDVHDANMSRVRGDNAKRPGQVGFDAVKPAGWVPPDHSWIANATRDRVALGMIAERRGITAEMLGAMSEAFIHCTKIRAGKGRDYNTSVELGDYFPMGHKSYFQMQWLKTLRCKSIIELLDRGMVPNYEGLLDTLWDQLNYVSFWVEAIQDGKLPAPARGADANGAVATKL